jgi:hypothetical protein
MMLTGGKETTGSTMRPSVTSALHIPHGLNQGQQAAALSMAWSFEASTSPGKQKMQILL